MKKNKIIALIVACLIGVLYVSCKNPIESDDAEKRGGGGISATPVLLSSIVGYDQLKLHGKFRQYQVDTANGDNATQYSNGKDVLTPIPVGTIKNGIEYPTFWSRLPLSIQPNNTDQHKGLYSIHSKGTSQIFPKSLTGETTREKDANSRQATSGVYVAFATDSSNIVLNYRYIMKTEAGTRAFSGIDIYEVINGTPVFKANLRDSTSVISGTFFYDCEKGEKATEKVAPVATKTERQFMVMLPTYNGFEVDSSDTENPSGLTFEFDEGAKTYEIEVFGESTKKPILIYGTSITQGDGAGGLRPGACYAAQIMLATKREVINCGFAGSAQMEYKMADFLSNIDAEVFVIDPGWNLTAGGNIAATNCSGNGSPANISNDEVVSRVKYMVRKYREKHPDTPIVICPKFLKSDDGGKDCTNVETLTNSNITMPEQFAESAFDGNLVSREGLLLYKAYYELKNPNSSTDANDKNFPPVTNLYWAKQQAKSGQNFVDGSNLHPGVVGMTNIANFILRAIKENIPAIYNGGNVETPQN